MADDGKDDDAAPPVLPMARALRPSAPAVVLARDAASRGPRELVIVDSRGHSQSPRRAVVRLAGVFGGWSLFMYAVAGMTWQLPVVGGLVAAWVVPPMRRQQRGNTLALHGSFEAAARELEPLATTPLAPAVMRGLARSTLSYIAACRGDHQTALAWAERGTRWPWPRLAVAFCRQARVTALVNLDRVGEARTYFDQHLRSEPRGDQVRHGHWTTELYLALAEGRHSLDGDELHRRARVALATTAARTLLALLAWAHHAAGDDDQARHLLREALDREEVEPLEQARPLLHAWIVARSGRAPAWSDA